MKRINLIGILIYFYFFSYGQSGKIEGVLLEKGTNAPLIGVLISVPALQTGTTSDSNGKFSLILPEGNYDLEFSYIGYEPLIKSKVPVNEKQPINLGALRLKEQAITLDEVVVTPGSFSIMGDGPLSKQVLTGENLKNMSWAEDITRAVARLPGISSSDYSSKFTVRGGESDEVLITLDGMELFEPFHQRDFSGGLFSIVDIQAIQGIDLMTGGFSAQYGNRSSGVFNMRTKNVSSSNTVVGASIMNARFYNEGTFDHAKGTYLFTARRGMLDQVFKLIGETETIPSFYDVMGKATYNLSNKNQLSFHFIHAGDRSRIRDVSLPNYDKYDTHYKNTYSWLTLKSTINKNLYVQTMAYAGHITHNRYGGFWKYELTDKGTFDVSDKRAYSLFGIKQDWAYLINDKIDLKAGFEIKQMEARYDYTSHISELRTDSTETIYPFDRTLDIHMKPNGQQLYSYATAKYKVLPRVILETGLRYDYTSYSSDKLWSPRFSAVYAFSKRTFIRGAFGKYYQSQFINTVDVNNGNTTFNPAKVATHYVLSYQQTFLNGINLQMAAYYKKYDHLAPQWQNLRDHLEVWPEARNDNARLIFNGASAKGLETFLKYDQGGKISWWFSYAIARAEDHIRAIQYPGLLDMRTGKVPRLNNQNHTIYADLNYRPTQKWHFNLSWQFYQGWPRTDYTYSYQTLPNDSLQFYAVHKRFNGVSYPAYHRMDVRVNRHFDLKDSKMTAYIHLINVYNRRNLKKFDLDASNDADQPSLDTNGNYVPFEDNKYWFGFIPVFGVSWEF